MSNTKKTIEAVRSAGLQMEALVIEEFLEGVVAAPHHMCEPDWISLIAPDASKSLKTALLNAKDDIAARSDHGFCEGPAPLERTSRLRAKLESLGFDGFVVPRADAFMGDSVPACSERLRWLTGFSGSAGVGIVLINKAAVFIDGRYTLQVQDQVNLSIYDVFNVNECNPWTWAAKHLNKGSRLAFDPWLLTDALHSQYKRKISEIGAEFVAVKTNPIDEIWVDQPAPPLAPITTHSMRFAGKSSQEKRMSVLDRLIGAKQDAALITSLDSIAWLLNIRGGDVPFTPLALSFLLICADGKVHWFVDKRKLLPHVTKNFDSDIIIQDIEQIGLILKEIVSKLTNISVDKSRVPIFLVSVLENAGTKVINGPDPCLLPKACKNDIEVEGIRAAHIRDGVAMTFFLAWLDKMAPKGLVTEISAAEYLEDCRSRGNLVRDLSFRTISGTGPNGAIVHYDVTSKTNKLLQPGDLYLIDSGAQYLDGTTDVTRTIYITGPDGGPSSEEKDRFTRVLKGHIAIATAEFPIGTCGSQIDILGRKFLWEVGHDYDHGTGHGVGSYLCVHEGPQRIAKGSGGEALKPGMVISNEPGFYKAGMFGVRIENLILVRKKDNAGRGSLNWLGFETLTCVPIDTRLVEKSLLTKDEITWLNNYHSFVRQKIEPMVDPETAYWLRDATKPLK